MEIFPRLQIGWLNGWVLLVVEFLIEGSMLLVFPKNVVSRLFDRSGWTKKQRIFTIVGKIGIIGLVIAMLNFRDTPLDQPVTGGVYKISRHPQIFSLFILFVGICIAIGSWPALIALVFSKLFQHFSILAEEEACEKKYGESYRTYMRRIPRYFLFF
jgi:protein-S-isoprenylcysteine O-methyltransferase Ste14